MNSYREEGAIGLMKNALPSAALFQKTKRVTYQTEYFWGWYNYLGMHFPVSPDGTGNSHSIFWISLDSMDLLELFQSSCPLVVIILQMCQRKICKYGSDCKTGTWHLLILKKSICTIFQYNYHGYARTISWKQAFLLLLCEFI